MGLKSAKDKKFLWHKNEIKDEKRNADKQVNGHFHEG